MSLRRVLADPAVLLALCAVLGAAVLGLASARRSEPPPQTVLQQFGAALDQQFHECVPLGWFPEVFPWRSYVSSYNASAADKDALFQAIWVGVLPARALDDPHAAAVKDVLDELTRLRLLARHDAAGEFRYTLTDLGMRYYYERDRLGNNVDGWPYVCFSRLHATEVRWASAPVRGRGMLRYALVARVRFRWEPTADAWWATPYLRAHAVELIPVANPAEATAVRYPPGRWKLTELAFALPLLEHPSAWEPHSSSR